MSNLGVMATRPASPIGARTLPAVAAVAFRDWASAETRWGRLSDAGEALAFQRTAWVRAWYRHCLGPGIDPLVVFLTDAETGADLMGLALVHERRGLRRVTSFADGGLTDYNAPLLGRACEGAVEGRALWRALAAALPATDLLRLEKMPTTIDGRVNPLVTLPGTRASKFTGNILSIPGTWDEWLRERGRHFTKELGRCRRVFERHPGAAFRRYGPGPDAERIYEGLKGLQRARIADLGYAYRLDDEPAASFYETIVRDGLRDGTAILTALTVGDEVIAALLGITDGTHYAMTRLATPGPEWMSFSPGRMIIERTMQMLHGDGYRSFDFTIGEYPYKRKLGASALPMVELHRALTPLGWRDVADVRFRAWARQPGALQDRLRRWRGQDGAAGAGR